MIKDRKDCVALFDSFEMDINEFDDFELQFMNGDLGTYEQISSETYEYTIEEIESFGGEGMGDEIWSVSKITEKSTNDFFYIRFEGYYDSWNGTDWNSWSIVEPRDVVVTQWFAKE